MKNLKILLPLIAVIFAVAGVFAMRAHSNKHINITTGFYEYNGTTSSGEDDPNNYSFISDPSSAGCDGRTQVVCVIQADGDGTHPSFAQGTDVRNTPGITVVAWKSQQ